MIMYLLICFLTVKIKSFLHETSHDMFRLAIRIVIVLFFITNEKVSNSDEMATNISVSCLKSNYSIEIKVNFQGLEDQYNQENKLLVTQRVNILNYFLGTVRIYDSDFKEKGGKHIDFWIVGVKELKGIICKIDSNPKCQLEDGKIEMTYKLWKPENNKGSPTQPYSRPIDLLMKRITRSKGNAEKLNCLNVTLIINFTANKEHVQKQSLIYGFTPINKYYTKVNGSEIKLANHAGTNLKKVKIICGNYSLTFDKDILCSVSDVFSAMFDNPNNIECQNGSVTLEDVDPDAIVAFKRFLNNHQIKEEDFNVSLLLFADRYNIQPIVELCLNNLTTNMTKENFPEIVKASDMIRDKGLLQAAVNFAKQNMGTFEDDPDVKKFMRANQDLFMKFFEEMMFKK